MLTLQELKQVVGEPVDRGKLPTAKQLRESGLVIAKEQLGGEAEISVYRDGCVLYQAGSRSTVFSLHSCGEYFYITVENAAHFPEHYFDKEKWYLRLVLEGEDRLARNCEEKERSWNISYSSVSEDWAAMGDLAGTVIERLMQRETVEEMLHILTEKQKSIVFGYYLLGKTQAQIAKELGVSRPAVRDSLFHAVNKIRKKYVSCSPGLQSGMAKCGVTQ